MFQCHSPKSSPPSLSQSPKDCSIHLCLFCWHFVLVFTDYFFSLYLGYFIHKILQFEYYINFPGSKFNISPKPKLSLLQHLASKVTLLFASKGKKGDIYGSSLEVECAYIPLLTEHLTLREAGKCRLPVWSRKDKRKQGLLIGKHPLLGTQENR